MRKFLVALHLFFCPSYAALAGLALAAINTMDQPGQGGTSQGGGPPIYQPGGLGSADINWQQLLGQMTGATGNLSGQVDPALLQSYAQELGINTQPLVGAGQQAGAQYGALAGLGQQYAGMLGGQAQPNLAQQQALQSAGNSVFQTALDPQSALYNRTQQQVQDQTRAALAATGTSMSPYAAGTEGNVMSNFNIDWQNQQLARQAQGLGAMSQANAAGNQSGQLAGADLSGAMGFAQGVPQSLLAQGATPISAQMSAFGLPAQAATQYAGNLGQTLAPLGAIQSQIIPYLNYGQGANSAGFGAYASNQAFGAQQQAANTQLLLNSLGGPSQSSPYGTGLYGAMNSPSSGGFFSNMFGGSGGGGGSSGSYNPYPVSDNFGSGFDQ